MKKILILALMLFPLFVLAQVNDDFEDGDITNWTESTATRWEASDVSPLNGSYSLHHAFDNPSNGSDQVSTPLSGIDLNAGTATWQFQIKYGYATPSSGNNWACFLSSDADATEMYPSGTANGYAIGVNYSGSDDILRLWKITSGAATEVINCGLNWEDDLGANIYGFQVTRSGSGEWTVFIDYTGGFDNLEQIGDPTINTDFTTANHFGFYYEYSSAQDRQFWADDISVVGAVGNDNDGIVSSGIESPTTVSSLTTSADGVQVFEVNFSDEGTVDLLPTIIDNITFTQGINNNIADWTNAIAGAKLFGTDIPAGIEGTVNATNITFASNNFISINDGENESYQLYIWLKTDLSNITDNDNIVIKLDYSDITCDFTGSSFGSGSVESGDNNIAIDIEATKINFVSYPLMVAMNNNFSLNISATDINNNIDTDNNSEVILSCADGGGNLTSTSGLTQNLNSGNFAWSDLKYDILGDFTIQAENIELSSTIITGTIECAEIVYHLNDDFEDADLLGWQSNDISRWLASDDESINGTYSLKHIYDNPESDIDIIAHPIINADLSTETKVWRFQVKYKNSAPSGGNNWSVFLMADNDETEMMSGGAINGYVVGINFGSETDDIIKLWNITNGTYSQTINTTFDWNNTDSNTPKGFEITRTPAGEWELKIDEDGGFDNLTSYGTATDSDHTIADYFGIFYKYSSTQDMKLTVDDVYFGPVIQDLELPVIDTVIAVSSTKLEVYFNEEIDKTTAENVTNYSVNNDIGNPETATKNISNNRLVELDFTTEFQSSTEYIVTTENVEDMNSNIILTSDDEFIWENINLISVGVVSNNQIDLYFSKDIDETSAGVITNYSINQTVGNPDNVIIDEDGTTVHLSFPTLFQVGQEYILTINNIEDINGNVMETTTYSFLYYEVQPFDVVINEIMIDVSPEPVALPKEKYIELYNTSSHDINLTDWTIQIGTNSEKTFPPAIIVAGEYLIICGAEDESLFDAYGDVIGFLSTSQISSTTSKTIIIRNTNGDVIENITYSSDWYNNDEKDDGGWALERIDPTNVCCQDNNWQASLNYIGGTPGMQNSVFGSNPDNQNPSIESFDFISSKHINVRFTEGIEKVSGESGINYVLNNTTTPLNISIDESDMSLVHLEFVENFNFGSNTIAIANISDNCSNTINDTTLNFIYQLINANDVEPKSANQIKVYFSETIDKSSAENVNNYSVNNGIGKPIIAFRDVSDTSIVHLQFENDFTLNKINTLTINGVNDINGNLSTSKNLNFTYHETQMFDIVFNEIMSDVNPIPVGLPEYQYVELYNTTDYVIWLSDWQFIAEGQSERDFPIVNIQPKSYLILSQRDEDFSHKGQNVNILGSSDVSNSGKEFLLKDNFGKLINYVNYSNLWYQDENKEDGGWSLEKIDPMNFCGEASNWAASIDIAGGTPGNTNSIYSENPNEIIPEITQVKIISSNHLLVEFNKNISFNALLNTANYSVNNNVGQPLYILMSDTSYSTVHIYFENQFVNEQTNTITISNIYDDCQNQMETVTEDFTYYLIKPETVWVLNNYQLKIKFTEEPSSSSVAELINYLVDKEIGNPNQAIKDGQDPSIIYLQFDNQFENGQTYNLSLINIKDENQNMIIDTKLEFTYYIAKVNDIVINELLFNPYSGGQDFVELYNRSIYPINMINMRIGKRNTETNEIENIYSVNEHDFILNPENYLVLTIDTAAIQMDYKTEGHFIEMSSMPSYADDEGIVVILNENDSIIDEFHYNEDMHYGLISNDDGISLERIDYNMPSDSTNWHSAAQAVGYATPGYENSQYKDMSNFEPTTEVTIDPQVFSPDNDGYDDITNIFYEFEEGGNIANILIYDVKGRLVRNLITNELLAASGYWIWDGLDDNQQKARIGIYAVIIEIFDIDGNVKTYKLASVIAGKH